jgi:DNA mismatch repair protein MutS
VAIADISTGFFEIESLPTAEIANVLARWNPVEIVLSDGTFSEFMNYFEPFSKRLTLLPNARFNVTNAKNLIETVYNVKTLKVFGEMQESEIQAAGVMIDYVTATQCNKSVSLLVPKIVHGKDFMAIDSSTRRNLEIFTTQSEKGISLFSVLNKTVTAPGRRLLQSWLSAPLIDIQKIEQRFDKIDFFLERKPLCSKVCEVLGKTPDIERIVSRLSFGRATPKDLLSLKIALGKADLIGKILWEENIDSYWSANLQCHQSILDLLEGAIKEQVPNFAREGNFIKDSFDEKLRYHRDLMNNASDSLNKMQKRYIDQTGISNLRVGRNNIWGIYIEVSSSNVSKVPFDFVHRQTLTNCTRYTTKELSELEKSINEAEHLALLREMELFSSVCSEVLAAKESLLSLSDVIAQIDLFSSMAYLAEKNNYVRPELSLENSINIEEGRHPVVESAFTERQEESFIPNDCKLNPQARRFLLVTGPNMAGKSTYLRENALIIIMAQAGFFVPAKFARIGIVDKIFSRIGSSDDIASGRSTFMVEMIETSAILNQATNRSFVILDEIGRGTATYDGLAIAWAVSEYVYNTIQCRTIFATHYHEITELTKKLPAMVSVTAAVREWENKIVFLHKIIDGVAKRSYGIHVAQLAGLPKQVIIRATELLNVFENELKGDPKVAKIAKLSSDKILESNSQKDLF